MNNEHGETSPARPRGRPLGTTRAEPSSAISTRLPVRAHDRLIQLAQRSDQSVSATIRQLLTERLR